MSVAQTAAPLALSATEHIVSASSNKGKSGDDEDSSDKEKDDEDTIAKCDQLAAHLPGIEEIRRTPELNIESREIRLQRTGEGYHWVAHRPHGGAPDAWRNQTRLDGLHFNPPLQYLLPDKNPRYLVYAVSTPESVEDSEQMIAIADNFGAKVGTFDWHNTQFTYTVSKHLPCFPEPQEK